MRKSEVRFAMAEGGSSLGRSSHRTGSDSELGISTPLRRSGTFSSAQSENRLGVSTPLRRSGTLTSRVSDLYREYNSNRTGRRVSSLASVPQSTASSVNTESYNSAGQAWTSTVRARTQRTLVTKVAPASLSSLERAANRLRRYPRSSTLIAVEEALERERAAWAAQSESLPGAYSVRPRHMRVQNHSYDQHSEVSHLNQYKGTERWPPRMPVLSEPMTSSRSSDSECSEKGGSVNRSAYHERTAPWGESVYDERVAPLPAPRRTKHTIYSSCDDSGSNLSSSEAELDEYLSQEGREVWNGYDQNITSHTATSTAESPVEEGKAVAEWVEGMSVAPMPGDQYDILEAATLSSVIQTRPGCVQVDTTECPATNLALIQKVAELSAIIEQLLGAEQGPRSKRPRRQRPKLADVECWRCRQKGHYRSSCSAPQRETATAKHSVCDKDKKSGRVQTSPRRKSEGLLKPDYLVCEKGELSSEGALSPVQPVTSPPLRASAPIHTNRGNTWSMGKTWKCHNSYFIADGLPKQPCPGVSRQWDSIGRRGDSGKSQLSATSTVGADWYSPLKADAPPENPCRDGMVKSPGRDGLADESPGRDDLAEMWTGQVKMCDSVSLSVAQQQGDHEVAIVYRCVNEGVMISENQLQGSKELRKLHSLVSLMRIDTEGVLQLRASGSKRKTLREVAVCPRTLRDSVVRGVHEQNHSGTGKTISKVKSKWFWPGMFAMVGSIVRRCGSCLRVNEQGLKLNNARGHLQQVKNPAWKTITKPELFNGTVTTNQEKQTPKNSRPTRIFTNKAHHNLKRENSGPPVKCKN